MALRIAHGTVFHGDPPRSRAGDVVIDKGTVATDPGASGDEVIDAAGCLVLPGFVIAHHHLYSTLARGMPGPSAAPRTFVEVLERIWWRLDRALDGDLIELSGVAGSVEALRCGVTGFVDHHASPSAIAGSLDRLAAGVTRAGARAVLCYEATGRHGDAGFDKGLEENRRFALAAHGRLAAMVGGHAPFTLSDAQLTALAALARAHDIALHLHVAEDAHDQIDARRRGASDVTARLARAGVLDHKAVIAHGVHLAPSEIERLAASRAFLTHQPRSNMNNCVGYLERARAFGDRLALGTDGINGDLLAEAQTAFFRLREHDRHAAAETVWAWLAGGWRLLSAAFGLEPERGFGWLDAGAPADVVVFDYDAATPVTAENLPWHLAFGLSARHVRDVVVAGDVVVRDRRPTRLVASDLARDARAGAERLWARMAELPSSG
jgi:putative selenium metabolism protein SsnA